MNKIQPPTNPAASHTLINWRQEYLHITVLLMTALWFSPWIALSLGWFVTISVSTALALGMIHMLIPLLLIRVMRYRQTSPHRTVLFTVVTMIVAAGITVLLMPQLVTEYRTEDRIETTSLFTFDNGSRIPAGPLLLLWILLLWARASRMSRVYVTLVRASFGMRLGILAFFWVLIFADQTLREDSFALLPFFFFFGLLSSGLARASSLGQDRPGRETLLGRGWIVSLVVITLLVTLVGYSLALWMAGMKTGLLARTFITIGSGLLTLLYLLLSPILLLIEVFFTLLNWLLPDKLSGDILGSAKDKSRSIPHINIPWLSDLASLLGNGLLIAIAAMLVIMILVLLWFLLVMRGGHEDDEGEERETLGTGEVITGMRQAFRDGWRRLADMFGVFRQFGLGRDLFAALTIRRIYAHMEKLAGERGYPRAIAETPYEYYRELARAFPGLSDDYTRITEAYIAVRYGDIPENDDDLIAVRTAWYHLKESLPTGN